MPLIIPTNSISAVGYDVANSLRFNDGSSDSLQRSMVTATSTRKFTVSMWIKKCNNTTGGEQVLFHTWVDSNNRVQIGFQSNNKLQVRNRTSGSDNEFNTDMVFRDTNAWFHIVVQIDSTHGNPDFRVRVYVNGNQVTGSGSLGSVSNLDYSISSSHTNYIGQYGGGGNFFDGYITEVVYLDGLDHNANFFGEFDEDTGVWKPKEIDDFTFGNNGFYLDFEDSSQLGKDVSGEGHNFTANNLTSIDQSTDTCTNNFCTFNPLSADEMTFSQGNLKVVTASSPRTDDNARGTMGVNSGKWYWEIKTSGALVPAVIGICFDELKMGSDLSGLTGVYAIQNASGTFAYKRENGTTAQTSGFPNPVNNDIINVALDCDNAKLYIGINGTYYNQAGSTGNPATGSNETFSGIDMSYFWLPWLEARSTDAQGEANFGGTDSFTISSGNSDGNGYGNFEYAVPSGYYALNTKNLAEYG